MARKANERVGNYRADVEMDPSAKEVFTPKPPKPPKMTAAQREKAKQQAGESDRSYQARQRARVNAWRAHQGLAPL
jgi:hypothetical protein